ncbi:hypothetical protein BV898_12703 [Hypsibius exemplaris]|uniref:Uncharacterized protein n=1 Tax=Hypsibius exemplaris TaxID=2072580 RepID=A0A1W0WCV3_HYPEX|nr:hypothetical protein BV898_12703 [Hypsibius exemplaris]
MDPPKKRKSTSKKKSRMGRVTPVDLPPDPVLIAIQARIAGKHRQEEADGFFKIFQRELESEISNDIKLYRVRVKEMFQDMRQRFIKDVTKYTDYLSETSAALNERLRQATSTLGEKYSRLQALREALQAQLESLRYLQALKEEQAETIVRLKKELDQVRENQVEEAQRIRLRHARHRLLDLEGREHRLHTVSEHLAKETLPYFVFRLESKMDENRKLRATISKRVNDIKYLQKFRSDLEAKERNLTFEYQHLLKYKRETSAAVKKLLPIKGWRTSEPISPSVQPLSIAWTKDIQRAPVIFSTTVVAHTVYMSIQEKEVKSEEDFLTTTSLVPEKTLETQAV